LNNTNNNNAIIDRKKNPDKNLSNLSVVDNSYHSNFNFSSHANTKNNMSNTFFEDNKELGNLDEVQKLKKLFLHYSNNEKKLSSSKFNKLITDADIVDNSFNSHYADILFYSTGNSKQNIDFNYFCEVLVKLSEIKYPEIYMRDQSAALNRLLNNNLYPLLALIIDNTMTSNKPSTDIIYKHFNNKLVLLYIDQHYYIMRKIYEKYFSWEMLSISNFQKREHSEKAFHKFLNDFEIIPNLVSIKRMKDIFENIITNQSVIKEKFKDRENLENLGSFFTLFNFIAAIYIISAGAYFNKETDLINGECYQMIFNKKIYNCPIIKTIIDTKSTPRELISKDIEKSNVTDELKNVVENARSLKLGKGTRKVNKNKLPLINFNL